MLSAACHAPDQTIKQRLARLHIGRTRAQPSSSAPSVAHKQGAPARAHTTKRVAGLSRCCCWRSPSLPRCRLHPAAATVARTRVSAARFCGGARARLPERCNTGECALRWRARLRARSATARALAPPTATLACLEPPPCATPPQLHQPRTSPKHFLAGRTAQRARPGCEGWLLRAAERRQACECATRRGAHLQPVEGGGTR